MTNTTKRRAVLKLRLLEKSYSQIKKEVNVSKSTLSRWLKDYPLSKERIRILRDRNEVRIEKFRQTMRLKSEKKMKIYYEEEKIKLLPLSNKELLLAGLFLYWGEGSKSTRHIISLNNTDPGVLRFSLYWLTKCFGIEKNKIRVYLHLYSDMNIDDEIRFWSIKLNMPIENFDKPYIKKSLKINLDQKGFGHGTCGIRIGNTELKDRILMAIKAVADYYGPQVEKI